MRNEPTVEDMQLASEFVNACVSADEAVLSAVSSRVTMHTAWHLVLREIHRVDTVPRIVQTQFARIWIASGEKILRDFGSEISIIDALRKMLPAYRGAALTLYRGQPARDYDVRLIGICWSKSIRIARDRFARGQAQRVGGETVLLRTVAQPAAIVSELLDSVEEECIVDSHVIDVVDVVERFPPMTPAEVDRQLVEHHKQMRGERLDHPNVER